MQVPSNPAERSSSRVLEVRLLGPLSILRDGVALALPASRKVRALFAYLALAPRAVPRGLLCELLWDIPNDPRGELRWSLSKIRSFIDGAGRSRIQARGDAVALDLSDCSVDAIEVAQAIQHGLQSLPLPQLRALAAKFEGDFAAGLEIDRSPAFNGWLTMQRRRFRSCEAAVLEQLVLCVADHESGAYFNRWLEIAPFDNRVHQQLLAGLARRGMIREGEEHLAATRRLFEAEGLDSAPLREAWQAARRFKVAAPRIEVVAPAVAAVAAGVEDAVPVASRRASVAVMPFVDPERVAGTHGGVADALAHDVITRLAKLRVLLVIAQGTVFALHERGIGAEAAARMLNVDYVVSGTFRRRGPRLDLTVELTESRSAHIVWTDVFNQQLDDTFSVLDEIGDRIVASIASEIEVIERNRAILRPPNSLDAWEAHHRGLWHMYRFNPLDNERARHYFAEAVRLDPGFARAHAGVSFTHFQNAFQGWKERDQEVGRAFEAAGHSLMADHRDPAAHWAMGRAHWLRGEHGQSVAELEQAIDISPNFALGHYTLAFVQSQAGDADAAIRASDRSRQLSPFDPLLFGMLGARAMALARLGRFDEAADWGARAAARPNAHAHILAIAACCLALAGRLDEARAHFAAILNSQPRYRVGDLLTAMRFSAEDGELFRQGARRIGMA